MAPPQSLPLLFAFVQVVIGDGFLASIRMNGRALLEVDSDDDGDEVWITGVTPVGITGGGADRNGAFTDFRRAWVETVFDIAQESDSFESFRTACAEFLDSEQESITTLWDDALERVRSEKYEDESLRREVASEHTFDYVIEEIAGHNLLAERNGVDAEAKVAA